MNVELLVKICDSLGLLEETQYHRLYQAGMTRMHNNLETSENYFPEMCSTHTFHDKVTAIKAAQACGMTVCSGGLFEMDESWQDQIDLAFSL
ncbi:TPA: hypothetical protein ACGBG5_003456 [Enterococcus faecalis]|uniref:hypothetical protein n=2 Tax=Enterococcus TaxID=1350 RepID=UPI0036D52406